MCFCLSLIKQMDAKRLKLNQVRRMLKKAIPNERVAVPPVGWLRSIREALGISLRQQAKRIGITPATLLVHERNEISGSITLEQMRKLAAALDCEMVYTLIPRHDLEDVLHRQAEMVARAEVLGISHTMALEKQQPSSAFDRDMIADRKRELLTGSWAKLWR